MAENYFNKFKSTFYANTFAINLTERITFYNTVPKSVYNYYSYDVTDGIRPDQIADNYYNDQYMDWIIYLSNGIIDPYYQWYMTSDKFNDFLTSKYNVPVPTLQNKIKFYRNNWYNGDNISVSDYNALPSNHHRYYQPIYNQDTAQIIRYVRTPYDWTINTNSLISVACVGTNFTNNEVVYVHFDNTNIGRGQVSFANSTSIQLQHVSGSLYSTITGSSYVYGTESGSNVAFTATTSLANNIVTGEEIYWDPVTIYDYESEKNEIMKNIKVLNSGVAGSVSTKLTDLLAQ